MKTSLMKESKFLKKEDVMPPVLVTMGQVEKVNVALEGVEPEYRWALHFDEMDKPMVLNQTNINLINSVTGTDDTDDWVGKQIVLYNDPTISYAGKVTGGIRVRGNAKQESPVVPGKPKPESFKVENKDNEADFLMTYNSFPKPNAVQIGLIKKICAGAFNDPKCEIKNRILVWNYYGQRWPNTDEEAQAAIESGVVPF